MELNEKLRVLTFGLGWILSITKARWPQQVSRALLKCPTHSGSPIKQHTM